MLAETIGAPADIRRREAMVIVSAAFGKRPKLPPGREYVRRLRPIWRGLLKKARVG